MNLKKYVLHTALIAISITACKKNGSNPSTDPTTKAPPTTPVTLPNVDIYLVGNTNTPNGSLTNATLWKNGKAVTLATDAFSYGSNANAIALKDTDVYVGGFAYSGSHTVACYWKNGVFTRLSNFSSYVSAITINGNDVYMAGAILDDHGSRLITYWKNGVAVSYPKDSPLLDFTITGIAINGDDIYLSGDTHRGSNAIDGNHSISIATYWKNGVRTELQPDNGLISAANAIVVNGNDIYVAGNNNFYATFWKNGILANLTTDAGNCDARAMAMKDNDVYISGYINGHPAYWKNNVATTLKNGQGHSSDRLANAIAVNSTGVYVANGLDADYVTLWYNGQSVNAWKGIGVVNGMIVKQR